MSAEDPGCKPGPGGVEARWRAWFGFGAAVPGASGRRAGLGCAGERGGGGAGEAEGDGPGRRAVRQDLRGKGGRRGDGLSFLPPEVDGDSPDPVPLDVLGVEGQPLPAHELQGEAAADRLVCRIGQGHSSGEHDQRPADCTRHDHLDVFVLDCVPICHGNTDGALEVARRGPFVSVQPRPAARRDRRS